MYYKSFGRKRSQAHRDTTQEITWRNSGKREISRKIARVQFEIQIGCHWNPNIHKLYGHSQLLLSNLLSFLND